MKMLCGTFRDYHAIVFFSSNAAISENLHSILHFLYMDFLLHSSEQVVYFGSASAAF